MCGSKLGWVISCPDFFTVFPHSFKPMTGHYLCLATATSVQIISSSLVMNHPAFLSCIVKVTSSVVKEAPTYYDEGCILNYFSKFHVFLK